MKLFDMKAERASALMEAENLTVHAAVAHRDLTQGEQAQVEVLQEKVKALNGAIAKSESNNSLSAMFPTIQAHPLLAAAPEQHARRRLCLRITRARFLAFLRSGGKQASSELSEGFDPLFGGYALPSLPGVSAALYESSGSAGGFAETVPTDPNIIPLAVPDLGVRSLARQSQLSTILNCRLSPRSGQPESRPKAERQPTLSQRVTQHCHR